jgi:hypothetical protein
VDGNYISVSQATRHLSLRFLECEAAVPVVFASADVSPFHISDPGDSLFFIYPALPASANDLNYHITTDVASIGGDILRCGWGHTPVWLERIGLSY